MFLIILEKNGVIYHSLTLHSRYFSIIIAMIPVFYFDYLVAFVLEDIIISWTIMPPKNYFNL